MANLSSRLHAFLIENAYLKREQRNYSLEYYFEVPNDVELPAVIAEVLSKKDKLRRECSIRAYTLPGVPNARCFTIKIYGAWLYGWGATVRPIKDYLKENRLIYSR